MNISVQLAVMVAAVCLCLVDGAPDGRMVRTKQQRPTRGFKNVEMMTARGFGKRDRPHASTERDVEQQPSMADRHQRRGTPAFKIAKIGFARDYGKRSVESDAEERYVYDVPALKKFNPRNSLMVAYDFGKRSVNDENVEEVFGLDNFWDMLESVPEKEVQETNDEKILESIPLDWFVSEMLNNPEFARSVVRKFVDLNQDGMLSSEELFRNI